MSIRSPLPIIGGAALVAAFVACGGGDSEAIGGAAGETAAAAAFPPVITSEAAEIYQGRCVTCHGADGAGDGPSAAALNPKPASFVHSSWQESVSDAQIERAILLGGAAVGKSPAMPGNPDLKGREQVVAALRAHIRAFGE